MARARRAQAAALIVAWCACTGGSGCELDEWLGLEVEDSAPRTVPEFDDAKFSNPTNIDNPYFPLNPGTTRTYEADTEEGLEMVVEEVLDNTREVWGVTCRVVRFTATLDGVVIEETLDFYAQDDKGNVWYLGEEVDNYNYDETGILVVITHEGAWEAGKDVADAGVIALPGYQMRASPRPGNRYHQEYYEGEAEDMADVVALNVKVTLSDGSEYTCLQTRDYTPLEPDVNEYKYYAAGVGLVLEEPVAGGAKVELVSIAP